MTIGWSVGGSVCKWKMVGGSVGRWSVGRWVGGRWVGGRWSVVLIKPIPIKVRLVFELVFQINSREA